MNQPVHCVQGPDDKKVQVIKAVDSEAVCVQTTGNRGYP